MADPNTDLDAFLTSVESKLRGPFSSGQIPRTLLQIQTSSKSNNGASDPRKEQAEYLERLAQVIGRADKIKSLRIMIGLLGLDSDQQILFREQIEHILKNAQDAPLAETWVRVLAGVVQDRLLGQMGEEAEKVLQANCDEVIAVLQSSMQENQHEHNEHPTRLTRADMDPTFAPIKYALMSNELRKELIPELEEAPVAHFTLRSDAKDAEILHIDERMELNRAKEGEAHSTLISNVTPPEKNKAAENAGVGADSRTSGLPVFPGANKSTISRNKGASSSATSSSLFMPSKPRTQVQSTMRVRKPGAIKKIVGQGRSIKMMDDSLKKATVSSTMTRKPLKAAPTKSMIRQKVSKFGGAKSKMQMIDLDEVKELQKKGAEATALDTTKGLKRKGEPVESEPTSKKVSKEPNAINDVATAMVNSAVSKYQSMVSQDKVFPEATVKPEQLPTKPPPKEEDWRHLLKYKSNKLTENERQRIHQFYTERYNPTPDQMIYKMKIHEERTTEPETGKPIKITYYLELDYSTFRSQQSRKTKRY